jgi:hypothetical protein
MCLPGVAADIGRNMMASGQPLWPFLVLPNGRITIGLEATMEEVSGCSLLKQALPRLLVLPGLLFFSRRGTYGAGGADIQISHHSRASSLPDGYITIMTLDGYDAIGDLYVSVPKA